MMSNPLMGGLYGRQGLMESQNSDLYGGMGFGESTYKGDNPLLSVINQRIAPGMAYNVMQNLGFQNEQLPNKFGMILNTMRNLSPGNRQGQVDKVRRRLSSIYGEQAKQGNVHAAEQGFGSGYTEGAALDAQNRAADEAGTYAVDLESPEGQLQSLAAALRALGMAMPDIEALLGINQPMEASRQYRNSTKGSGSILGGLSGLLGNAASSWLSKPQPKA